MFCPNCGSVVEDGLELCPHCNEKLESIPVEQAPPVVEEEPVVPAAVQEPAAEPVPAPVYQQPIVVVAPPAPRPVKQPWKKPHIALRILMQLLSFVLSVCLVAGLLAAVVLADVKQLTSAGGINTLISSFLNFSAPAPRPHVHTGTAVLPLYFTGEEDGSILDGGTQIPDEFQDITIPPDLLEDVIGSGDIGPLIDFAYDAVQARLPEPLPITREQLKTVIAKSSISQFISDKLASFAEDFINGTYNTTITPEEIQQLLEENMALIESEFGLTVPEETKEQMKESVSQVVEELDINTTIRETMDAEIGAMLGSGNAEVGAAKLNQLRQVLQFMTSDSLFYGALACCAALMLLILLANFYNIPAGMTWIGVPSLILGALLSAPLLVLNTLPAGVIPAEAGVLMQALGGFSNVLVPIHSSLLILGLVLLIASIVWRIVRASVRKRRQLAARQSAMA